MSPSLSTATLLALLFSSIAVLSNAQLGSFRDRPIEVRQFSANFTNFVASYSMLVPSEADGCPQGTLLMVAVLSKRSGWDRRNFIRQTYGRHLLANQVLKFVVGKAPSGKQNATEDILLAEELHRFGDIFFYGLEDSYDNLPLKVLALMQWQQAFCEEAKFLLKIDDDVLADLPRLGHWLERKLLPELAKKPKMIFGHVLSKRFGNAQLVIRDPESKWRLSPEDFPDPLFPDYVDGPAYLVSSAAVQAILEQVPKGRFIRIEDALFTGIFRERAGVSLSDQEPFIQIYCGLVDCPGNTPSKPFVGPRFNVEDVYNRIEQNYKANWNDSRPVQRLIRKEMNARGTELNCRLDLQKRCSGQVPITSIWCPGDKMRTLADYTALYAELHSIKCESTHPETR